ncbi:dTDP-4-dehydrorhamnose reductase [Motilibacter rhizosphaerae]|uniref:dTDP-4-dehydrorhamnose reductase n=1 Tax=Motilibacter rhizosphaerae TaxID=598652 RepID=A0A4Q7NQH2_9ACTN|nr:dTDP-4-dehydrorhamnose reductase [Motilibacter rhizosphaerae]RZS87382.1 dTDP-4-dehydrorhamnose reductase [Motilibacter rhizosphaerae]
MATWLVTGAGGMLGRDVVSVLRARGEHVDARTRADLDLLHAGAVAAAVEGADVVVNCAAWTDVDGAETAEAAATELNGTAVATLAVAAARSGARLLHPSTDYVFAGDGTTPYAEDAPTAPINAYGRSKLVGEEAVRHLHPAGGFVVRTAWLYAVHGKSFVGTMARLAAERGPDGTVDVVDDQRGQPTWSHDLAEQLVALGLADAPAGTYHGTSSGETTWYGLARETFALLGHDPERVLPTTSEKFVRPAKRPAYSVLGHGAWATAGLEPLRDWREALAGWAAAHARQVPVVSV